MPLRRDPVSLIRRLFRWALVVALGLGAALTVARAGGDGFLDPEAAFALSARAVDEHSVELLFTAAPGYYLYREPFRFTAVDAVLGTPTFPAGKVKFDETFQKNVETFRGEVRIVVPVTRAPAEFSLMTTSQGCADRGLCYPPAERAVRVRLRGFGGDGSARALTAAETSAAPPGGVDRGGAAERAPGSATPVSGLGESPLDATLRTGHFWGVVGVFFVAGLLLSLTPCVLPMLPILSSIIVGHGASASRLRGLGLAASYSLGMAIVYTSLGIAAGLAGEGLAAALQTPWVLSGFALLLVLLALSMFGAYELRLPNGVSGRLAEASRRLPGGRVVGVFAMGGLSALIVSPCVAAPLAGALVYLGQTRDVGLGGTALFSLATGMSVPLLLVGASAGALLPRTGAWMEEVKRFFGLLLLGVALWTVRSVMPGSLVLAGWGALALAAAVLVVSPPGAGAGRARTGRRCVAAVLAACGLLQLAGAASGGDDPLQPLARLGPRAPAPGPAFAPVRSVAELDAAVRAAGRPVMLDFYADWCVSCKEMERDTFTRPDVRRRLDGMLLLRADVTANTADDRALLKRFELFGPPGTLFFDAGGREVRNVRVIGFEDGPRFLQSLTAAGL